jgi:hypothetical protein
VFRPDIVQMRQRVRAEIDSALPDGAARVGIRLTSGEVLRETVMAAKGSLADPLSDRDIEAKLRDGLLTGGSDCNADRVIEAVWRLDTLADIGALMNPVRTNPNEAGRTIGIRIDKHNSCSTNGRTRS